MSDLDPYWAHADYSLFTCGEKTQATIYIPPVMRRGTVAAEHMYLRSL
jgi:hypothetical protein